MLVLDENLPASQRRLLRNWRIRFQAVGADVAAPGTRDENLIPVRHRLPRPTFFSLDRDFHRPDWKHADYGLVWLDVRRRDAAAFIRRFLQHPAFDTQAKRTGVASRVHADGVLWWRAGKRLAESTSWLRE